MAKYQKEIISAKFTKIKTNRNFALYEINISHLQMGTLVVDLSKEPINPVITRQKDGVVLSRIFLQLDGNWH